MTELTKRQPQHPTPRKAKRERERERERERVEGGREEGRNNNKWAWVLFLRVLAVLCCCFAPEIWLSTRWTFLWIVLCIFYSVSWHWVWFKARLDCVKLFWGAQLETQLFLLHCHWKWRERETDRQRCWTRKIIFLSQFSRTRLHKIILFLCFFSDNAFFNSPAACM